MMPRSARLAVVGSVGAFAAWGMFGATDAEPAAHVGPEDPTPPSPAPPASTPAPTPSAPTIAFSRPPKGRARIVAPSGGALPVSIAKTEVTVVQFRRCAAAGACSREHFIAEAATSCNFGAADRGQHPMNCVDWFGAEQYCAFDGGRLCTADEWFTACRGPEDRDYPYGTTFDPTACTAGTGATFAGTTPAGARASCEQPSSGVRDMTGNVTEWIADCKGTYCKMAGGGFRTNEPTSLFASCTRACSGNQKTFRSSTIGFRCCYDSPER